MSSLAISSWSLHIALGPTYPGLDLVQGKRTPEYPFGSGTIELLELPATVAALGIYELEICHFHFPTTEPSYLETLRGRLAAAEVRPLTLLIDDGDLSSADEAARARDIQRIRDWIEVGAALGMRRVRVIAGREPAAPDTLARSIDGLSMLANYAQERGIALVTENWLALTARAEDTRTILEGTQRAVGLCVDFGNYSGEAKYDELATLMPYASSTHAKANFLQPGLIDSEDFSRCLMLSRAAGFDGYHVLIFDSPGDERSSIAQIRDLVLPYL